MFPAIKVENLSKRYRLGLTHSGSIRELVNGAASRLFRRKTVASSKGDTSRVDDDGNFWALKDINFEINAGEVVGIIGRNGAGKSTLLKILSRITLPSSGRIEMRGRVASLLEVGTGFHPELTGRENVYMNGTILGMTKQEIARRFDAIVEFAGVENFIDTPVKRYSSGMTVRLGFAVAAHLEPEILIVDEVLAVGDAEFQAKCLGKMNDVAKSGRTVLFVSHQIESIQRLTHRCMCFEAGKLWKNDLTKKVIYEYLRSRSPENEFSSFIEWPEQHRTDDNASLRGLQILNENLQPTNEIEYGKGFHIQIELFTKTALPLDVAIVIENAQGVAILSSHLSDSVVPNMFSGSRTYRVHLAKPLLKPARYKITTSISTGLTCVYHAILHYPAFSIGHSCSYRGAPPELRWGDLIVPFSWTESIHNECSLD